MEEKLILIEKEISPFLDELSLELADIEYVREGGYNFLRLYVEKIDGNTSLDDCIALSTKIDAIVDNLITDKFYLEVSTPGLERKLKKEKDFIRFKGKVVKIKTKNNIEDKKSFEGKLVEYKDNNVYVMDTLLNKEIEIPFDKIKVARLVFSFTDKTFKEESDEI